MPSRIRTQGEVNGDPHSTTQPNTTPHTSAQNGTVEDEEQEYHTSTSQASLDLDVVDDNTSNELTNDAPLLPPELLRPHAPPSPAPSPLTIPHSQMTRQQKRIQRNLSRQAKKEVWEKLKRDSQGSGVLEAGRVAQLRRGVTGRSTVNRVRNGRVGKAGKRKMSGRQQLVERRKRATVQRAQVGAVGHGKRMKGKTAERSKSKPAR